MIGDRIKRQRELRGMTQEQISADPAFGINPNTLAAYERNGREPRIETIIKLVKYFGVTSDYLIGITDYETTVTAAVAEQIPLSDSSIKFLKECSPEQLEVIDWILSSPSVSDFLDAMREYGVNSFTDPEGFPDPLSNILVRMAQQMTHRDFMAYVDRLKWENVSMSLEAVYRDIRYRFDPTPSSKVGRPRKRGPFTKKAPSTTDGTKYDNLAIIDQRGADDGDSC
ncbi:helix-turn-helix transcriptional regulator [Oscillospiraceae bacterium WX1]